MRKDCDVTCPLRSGEPSREPDEPIQLRSHEFVDQPSVAKQLYLPIKDWQTRVLILHSGPFNSPLVADLVTVDLILSPGVVIHDTQEKIQYTALSYTWGPPDFSQRLVVNGFQCSIAENLFRYLQRRRQRLQTLALWVDAICINQHDNAEKSMQVASMLHIYQKAVSTDIWLGEAGPTSHFAMEYLCWQSENDIADRSFKHTAQCRCRAIDVIEGMKDLYRRPWLQRIWIRQEVWAANKLHVICGSCIISWNEFADGPNQRLHDLMKAVSKKTRLSMDHAENLGLENLTKGLSRRQNHEPTEAQDDRPAAPYVGESKRDIINTLNRSIDCQATDERDRIYGIVGMTNVQTTNRLDLSELHLVIDYGRSLSHVFCDVARYLMRRESSTSALLCLQGNFGSADLPSWCPDWRLKTSWMPYLQYEDHIRRSERGVDKQLIAQGEENEESDYDEENEELEYDPRRGRSERPKALCWTPLQDEISTMLTLKGTKLVVLTADASSSTVEYIRMRPLRPQRADQIFGESAWLKERAVDSRFKGISQQTTRQYAQKFRAIGNCEVEVKFNGHLEKYILSADDVESKNDELLVVPLRPFNELKTEQSKRRERKKWLDVKAMHATPMEDNQVPIARIASSRLFQNYSKADDRAKSRPERLASQQAESGGTKSVRVENENDSTDNSEIDTTDSDSDDSDTTDDSDVRKLDALFIKQAKWAKQQAYHHFSPTTLNSMYNEHFPTEFAVPKSAKPGDIVTMLQGCALPLVLRPLLPNGSGQQYTFVGPAFLTYQSVYLPKKVPNMPKSEVHPLEWFFRPQRSIYEHFLFLLGMRLEEGTAEVFEIV